MAPSSPTSERLGKTYPLVVCKSSATHKRLVQQYSYQPIRIGTSEVLRKITAFKPMKRIFYADQIRVSRILQHLYEMATANGYETRYTSADSINHYATTIRNGNRHVEKDQSKKFPHPVGCRMPMPVSVGALSILAHSCYASASIKVSHSSIAQRTTP